MFCVRISFVLTLTGTLINGATSMTHTLASFRTLSTQVPKFPDYVVVNTVNGLPVYYYDSKTQRVVPTQQWMNGLTEEDPDFWERNTQMNIADEQQLRAMIETVRQAFNLTQGLHVLQWMVGCEWDDKTDEINGYSRYAFDGEDFISLDWETVTWVAAKPQAVATKLSWENIGEAVRHKNQLIHYGVVALKRMVRLGEQVVKRKELPLVSFLQKSSSSPVTCHATGFYPDRAMLFWAKDGEELEEEIGETLPNHDGTLQSSVSLDLSTVPTEDWGRYSCVFQLSGVPDDLITKLDPSKILTNDKNLNTSSIIIIAVVLSALGLAVVTAVGIVLYRRSHNTNVL